MHRYFENVERLGILQEIYDEYCKQEKQGFDLLDECDLKGMSYDSTPVQTSVSNQMENGIIRAEAKYEKLKQEIEIEKRKLQEDMLHLERKIMPIRVILARLTEEENELIELRYKEIMTLREIGQEVHRDKESIRQDLKRIERYIRRNK